MLTRPRTIKGHAPKNIQTNCMMYCRSVSGVWSVRLHLAATGDHMKYLLAMASSFTVGVLVTVVTAAGVPMKVHYVGHELVASTMVKGGSVLDDNGMVVLANRAVQRGAELHDK